MQFVIFKWLHFVIIDQTHTWSSYRQSKLNTLGTNQSNYNLMKDNIGEFYARNNWRSAINLKHV